MIIENEMSHEIFIEDIKTSGTIVINSISLISEQIKKGESKKITYQIVSPDYNYENNYIQLNIYNKTKEEYEGVKIAWSLGSSTKVIPGYYINDFFRATQKYTKNNLYITFYDYDEPNIVKILSLELILRRKSNLRKQQRESEETIKEQSGLTTEEIDSIDYEKYNF